MPQCHWHCGCGSNRSGWTQFGTVFAAKCCANQSHCADRLPLTHGTRYLGLLHCLEPLSAHDDGNHLCDHGTAGTISPHWHVAGTYVGGPWPIHLLLLFAHAQTLTQEVLNVLVLLFAIMLFYAWFGVVMFVDTDEGNLLFPNLVEALWTLWICVTTANYPDVMLPGYNQNRWVALYFVSFMALSFFFLINLVLAQVINQYDSAVENHRKRYVENSRQNLAQAFELLRQSSDCKGDRIDRSTVMDLFSILNLDFPEFRTLSDDDTKLLFAVLDRDGNNSVSEEEFMDFGNVLLLEFVNAKEYTSVIERNYPAFHRRPFWQKVCSIVNSIEFEVLLDLVLVTNAVVVAIQSWPELSRQDVHLDSRHWDGSRDTVWEVMETVFTVIYCLEAAIKIMVKGWKKYIESAHNVFDFSVTVMAVVSSAIVFYPNDYSDSRLIRMILSARVLRLIRLLTAWKPFRLIGLISGEILPAASSVFTVLFIVMYFFATMVCPEICPTFC
jgi:two pore calcium channel protein, plant